MLWKLQAISEVLPCWNGMKTGMRFHAPAVDAPLLDANVELEKFEDCMLNLSNTK